jgi:hypothetical protein
VRGDGSAGDINWYGVVKKIYALDFPTQKEVILFECNWYDVPATRREKVEDLKGTSMGLSTLMHLDCDI